MIVVCVKSGRRKRRDPACSFELAGSLLRGARLSACWLLLHAAACEVNRGGSRGGAQGHDGHDSRGLVASLGQRVASRSGDGLLLGGGDFVRVDLVSYGLRGRIGFKVASHYVL